MKNRKKLSYEERRLLYKYRRLGYSQSVIAKSLDRSRSTISRELSRNGDVVDRNSDYFEQAQRAQEATHNRRVSGSKRMRLKSEEIRHYVELHLKEARWSPEVIAGKLTSLGYPISHEAIYQYILEERPDLKDCLWQASKKRRRRRGGKKHRKPKQGAAPKRGIEELPEEAKNRERVGDFELDAMLGKRGTRTALQNLTCRKSRKVFLTKVENLEAKTYADALISRVKRDIPEELRHTILQDNGSEHAEHALYDKELDLESFFCHPYCASERGTVENRIKSIRRFLPKGTDLSQVPDEDIEWIEDYINSTPMKVLAFQTPNQIWEKNAPSNTS